jgi:2-phospho-L-lactate guanylyltransferase (CobY/MobA/RfbA family)
VLIVPADLPLITPQDIRYMLEFANEPPVVVVAPDTRRQGTNALLVCPSGLIEYDFGPGLFSATASAPVRPALVWKSASFPPWLWIWISPKTLSK